MFFTKIQGIFSKQKVMTPSVCKNSSWANTKCINYNQYGQSLESITISFIDDIANNWKFLIADVVSVGTVFALSGINVVDSVVVIDGVVVVAFVVVIVAVTIDVVVVVVIVAIIVNFYRLRTLFHILIDFHTKNDVDE